MLRLLKREDFVKLWIDDQVYGMNIFLISLLLSQVIFNDLMLTYSYFSKAIFYIARDGQDNFYPEKQRSYVLKL